MFHHFLYRESRLVQILLFLPDLELNSDSSNQYPLLLNYNQPMEPNKEYHPFSQRLQDVDNNTS